MTSFSAQGLPDQTRVLTRLQTILTALRKKSFQAHSGCWLHSAPCGCGTEMPVSLLSAKGHPRLLKAPVFLAVWPPASSKPAAEDLPCAESISHFRVPFQGSPVPSKDSCGEVRSTQHKVNCAIFTAQSWRWLSHHSHKLPAF